MGGTAEVGTPVKADASFSVSRALQLQLPKQLAILEEVSEYASREYSLERALDKMQVCAADVSFFPVPCQQHTALILLSICVFLFFLLYVLSTYGKYLCVLARQMPLFLSIPGNGRGTPFPPSPLLAPVGPLRFGMIYLKLSARSCPVC